jgi:hypothetical protein
MVVIDDDCLLLVASTNTWLKKELRQAKKRKQTTVALLVGAETRQRLWYLHLKKIGYLKMTMTHRKSSTSSTV